MQPLISHPGAVHFRTRPYSIGRGVDDTGNSTDSIFSLHLFFDAGSSVCRRPGADSIEGGKRVAPVFFQKNGNSHYMPAARQGSAGIARRGLNSDCLSNGVPNSRSSPVGWFAQFLKATITGVGQKRFSTSVAEGRVGDTTIQDRVGCFGSPSDIDGPVARRLPDARCASGSSASVRGCRPARKRSLMLVPPGAKSKYAVSSRNVPSSSASMSRPRIRSTYFGSP